MCGKRKQSCSRGDAWSEAHPHRNDAKTVSIVAMGCFHPVVKVQNACVHFFLGSDEDKDDSESEDEGPDIKKLLHQRQINKKTKSNDAQMDKAKKKAKKVRLSNASIFRS